MRALVIAAALMLATASASAQPVDEPIPRVVADFYALWGGLPASEGWVPGVPVATPIPNRGFGFAFGGHWHPMRLGFMTFGVGATWMTVRGTGDPASVLVTPAGSRTPVSGEGILPVVTTRMTSVLPQVSINFGRRFGWSYLSAGYGPTKIDSTASAVAELPEASAPNQWNPAINFGGGARWFMKRHVAAAFDVRFTKLGSRSATDTSLFAKRSQVVSVLVGISLQ